MACSPQTLSQQLVVAQKELDACCTLSEQYWSKHVAARQIASLVVPQPPPNPSRQLVIGGLLCIRGDYVVAMPITWALCGIAIKQRSGEYDAAENVATNAIVHAVAMVLCLLYSALVAHGAVTRYVSSDSSVTNTSHCWRPTPTCVCDAEALVLTYLALPCLAPGTGPSTPPRTLRALRCPRLHRVLTPKTSCSSR